MSDKEVVWKQPPIDYSQEKRLQKFNVIDNEMMHNKEFDRVYRGHMKSLKIMDGTGKKFWKVMKSLKIMDGTGEFLNFSSYEKPKDYGWNRWISQFFIIWRVSRY